MRVCERAQRRSPRARVEGGGRRGAPATAARQGRRDSFRVTCRPRVVLRPRLRIGFSLHAAAAPRRTVVRRIVMRHATLALIHSLYLHHATRRIRRSLSLLLSLPSHSLLSPSVVYIVTRTRRCPFAAAAAAAASFAGRAARCEHRRSVTHSHFLPHLW